MKFCSTRGGVKGLSFQEALLCPGYASDGGLVVPEAIPRLSVDDIRSFAGLTYPEVVEKLLGYFVSVDELSPTEIHGLLDGCFERFRRPEVAVMTEVGTIHVLELWHGPTGSFKDLALTVTSCLVNYFLQKENKRGTVLVGTSGDTGSSAIQGTVGKERLSAVVLYPLGRVTRVQELQMTTVDSPNIVVCAAEGTSDEIDTVLRNVFTDAEFASKHMLLSFNSINVARVLVQIAHFFYGYLKVCPRADQEAVFCVPSGALGNIAAGYVACCMGLPVKLVACVNENDVFHRTLVTGELSLSKEVIHTYSSAMDIQVPYNFERLLFFMSHGKGEVVRGVMETFERVGSCIIPHDILEGNMVLSSTRADTEETLATMRRVWTEHRYALCPHTAVAMHAAALSHSHPAVTVVVATATPTKFGNASEMADVPLPNDPAISELFSRPERVLLLKKEDDWVQAVKLNIDELTKLHK